MCVGEKLLIQSVRAHGVKERGGSVRYCEQFYEQNGSAALSLTVLLAIPYGFFVGELFMKGTA